MSGYTKTDLNYDALFAGDYPVVTKSIQIVSGAGSLVRGTLLGKVTASGKHQTSLAAAVDGSEVPVGILAEAVDASLAEKRSIMYESGEFNEARLAFGTGHTANGLRDVLRTIGIHLKTAVAR